MSGKFQMINRDTTYLPEKHLARFVVDMVDRLDLRELETVMAVVASSRTIRRYYWRCRFTAIPPGYSPSWSRRTMIRWRFTLSAKHVSGP